MGNRRKSTVACDISMKVRTEVLKRDNGCCIICGSHQNIQLAHYISRARMGLGIAENLACMCIRCHAAYDHGSQHKEIGAAFRDYLESRYEGWDGKKLVYRKGNI